MNFISFLDKILIASSKIFLGISPKKELKNSDITASIPFWELISWIPAIWLLIIYIVLSDIGLSQKYVCAIATILFLIFDKFSMLKYTLKNVPLLLPAHLLLFSVFAYILTLLDNPKIFIFLLFPSIIYIKTVIISLFYNSFKIKPINMIINFSISSILFYGPTMYILNMLSTVSIKASFTISYSITIIVSVILSLIIFKKKISYDLLEHLTMYLMIFFIVLFYFFQYINFMPLFN